MWSSACLLSLLYYWCSSTTLLFVVDISWMPLFIGANCNLSYWLMICSRCYEANQMPLQMNWCTTFWHTEATVTITCTISVYSGNSKGRTINGFISDVLVSVEAWPIETTSFDIVPALVELFEYVCSSHIYFVLIPIHYMQSWSIWVTNDVILNLFPIKLDDLSDVVLCGCLCH